MFFLLKLLDMIMRNGKETQGKNVSSSDDASFTEGNSYGSFFDANSLEDYQSMMAELKMSTKIKLKKH